MWLGIVLAWLHAAFAVSGDARPLDLAELIVYNLARTGPPSHLIYAQQETTLFVNFFTAGQDLVRVEGRVVRVTQRTAYPRDGNIELRIEPDTRAIFTIAVRFPGWTRGQLPWGDRYHFESSEMPPPTLIVNGDTVRMTFDRGFAKVRREWRSGDVVHVYLPMPEHRVLPRAPDQNPSCGVKQRGPMVWCG